MLTAVVDGSVNVTAKMGLVVWDHRPAVGNSAGAGEPTSSRPRGLARILGTFAATTGGHAVLNLVCYTAWPHLLCRRQSSRLVLFSRRGRNHNSEDTKTIRWLTSSKGMPCP